MKVKLPNLKPKSRYLIYCLLLLISFQSFAENICGNIEGFEFINLHESVNISDGETYVFNQ